MAKSLEQIQAELEKQMAEVIQEVGDLVSLASEDIAYLRGTVKNEKEVAAMLSDVLAKNVKLPGWVPAWAVKYVIAYALARLGKKAS